MSATTAPRTGSAPRSPMSSPASMPFRPSPPRCLRAPPSAPGAGSTSISAQSTSALLGHKVAEHLLEGGAPRALNVPAGSYQTSDGWMMVTLVNEPQYKRLCAATGRDDLAGDPRFADFARRADSADALIGTIARGISHAVDRSLAVEKLHAADLIAERILSPGDWLRNVHVEAIESRRSARTRPASAPSTPPRTPGHSSSMSEDDLCGRRRISVQDSLRGAIARPVSIRGAIDRFDQAPASCAPRCVSNQGRSQP